MSIAPLKIALSVAGVSGVGLGGYGIYYFASSKETIGEKITSSLAGRKERFLSKEDSEWAGLKEKYDSLSDKPKATDGLVDLPFSELPNWCDRNYREKYSEDKLDLYKQVSTFCFFNTNTVLGELEGRSLVSDNRDDAKWQTAWDSYNTNKTSKKLEITISSGSSKLNESDRTEGGKALYDWCVSASKKKMYSADISTLFPRFETWCISQ